MADQKNSARPGRVSLTVGLGVIVMSYWVMCYFYPGWMFAIGINHFDKWFIDTSVILASNDAVSFGLDPYQPNPLDYLHRPHVYSHWWLHLRDLGLTRADANWVGLGLAGMFLVMALWRLRPHGPRQFFWYAAVLGSSPVLLAVERGNNDLVIFILLAPLVTCLRDARRVAQGCALCLLALAAALKYYPAAAGLLLLAAVEARQLRGWCFIMLPLLAYVAIAAAGDLAGLGALAPPPEGLMSFGATAFFNVIGWTGWVPKLLVAAIGLGVVIYFWFTRVLQDWEPAPEESSDWLHFVLGAVLLAGCFFTNMNFDYRWIFAIWLAPLLWDLSHPADQASPVGRLARTTRWLLLAALWWGPFACLLLNRLTGVVPHSTVMRWATWFFMAEQPLVWALFVCLLAFLTHFVRVRIRALSCHG